LSATKNSSWKTNNIRTKQQQQQQHRNIYPNINIPTGYVYHRAEQNLFHRKKKSTPSKNNNKPKRLDWLGHLFSLPFSLSKIISDFFQQQQPQQQQS